MALRCSQPAMAEVGVRSGCPTSSVQGQSEISPTADTEGGGYTTVNMNLMSAWTASTSVSKPDCFISKTVKKLLPILEQRMVLCLD